MSAHRVRRVGQRAPRVPGLAPAAGIHYATRAAHQSHHERGFTLLEVIAAIMLLAIAFTALMKVAGASIALTQNAAAHSAAAMWARSKLDTEFVVTPLKTGQSSGQFDRKFAWQLDVTPWLQTGPAAVGSSLQLYQLDLKVTWGPPSHPRSAHFRTLRLATAQPDADAASGLQP